MNRVLRILLIALAILVLLGLFFGLTGDKDYHVKRTADINAPVDVIFPLISNLKKMNDWSPWVAKDPDIVNTYEGDDGTVGSINRWEGNDQVGVGEQEITKIVPNQRVETQLRFKKPYEDQSDSYIEVAPGEGGSSVTWGLTGEIPFMQRVMFGFMRMNLDKAVGPEFENGLAALKGQAEKVYADFQAAEAAKAAEVTTEEASSE